MRKFILVLTIIGLLMSGFVGTGAQVRMELQGGGSGSVWKSNKVKVLLFTREDWVQPITDAFDELEANGSKKLPRFDVRPQGREDCGVNRQQYKQPTIIMCSEYINSDYTGVTIAIQDHHTVDQRGVKVVYDNNVADQAFNPRGCIDCMDQFLNLIRHEIMHAVSWVNDCYGCRSDSAVQGYLPYFGPWDYAFIKKAYKHHDKGKKHDHNSGRNRRGGKR